MTDLVVREYGTGTDLVIALPWLERQARQPFFDIVTAWIDARFGHDRLNPSRPAGEAG